MSKWLWIQGLLCCAFLNGQATAQEVTWRSTPSTPVAATSVAGTPTSPFTLGRPVPAASALPALPPGKYRGKLMDAVPESVRGNAPVPFFDLIEQSDESIPRPIASTLPADFLPPAVGLDPLAAAQRGWILVDKKGNPILERGSLCEGCWECFPCQRFYVSAEYLYWWTRGQRIPPLVTTGSVNDPEDIRGALGAPGTQILFGNQRLDPLGQSGGRFTVGYWFDECCEWALEGNYFFLGRNQQSFLATSDQFPVIARPFFNINTGTQDRQLTASPGTTPGDVFKLTGQIAVNLPTRLQGAELNLKRKWLESCDFQVNLLAGFRYLDLQEGLVIQENGQSQQAVAGTNLFDPGTFFQVRDSFGTRNTFYGGQIGASAEWKRDRWFVEGRVKIALGVTHESLSIDGGQTFLSPNGTVTNFTGGLLAVPSNIGRFSRDRFSVVPEVGVKLGYQVTDNVRVFVGYDFLYWSDVIRPGDQVDTVVNVTQVPNFCQNPAFCPPNPAQRPAVLFRTSNFWAQGVSAGVEVRY
ncbi:MAG: BBP7 family outer membrane beta-barrel protein [Planctomycetes bacterium]|nr:BBP7 family outer membrane beta-barrel protein [Planctomycetota bacterium]